MRSFPLPFVCRLLLLCVSILCAATLAKADDEPLKVGDRIDVTLASGAVFEYAKVIEISPTSIMVASPQGVREFDVKFLSPDLQARMPGAHRPAPAPTPTPVAAQPAAQPAPVTAVDLDALAKAIGDKIAAQMPRPAVVEPAAETVQAKEITQTFPATPQNTFQQVLALGLILIIPTLNVLATRSAIQHASGIAVPVWILAIWLLPLVGCLSAFAALGREQPVTKS